jgi:hypothetical protein
LDCQVLVTLFEKPQLPDNKYQGKLEVRGAQTKTEDLICEVEPWE